MDRCSKCGAPIENGKCTYCGEVYKSGASDAKNSSGVAGPSVTVINQVSNINISDGRVFRAVSSKSKGFTLLLVIFLGYFGAHYFYVGKVGMGLLYLFTLGIFGIGWIVDIFRIAAGNFTDSRGLPII